MAFTAGTRETKVKESLFDFEQKIWEVNEDLKKEYNDTTDFIGYTVVSIGRLSDGSESGSHAGNVNVLLKDMDGRAITSFAVASKVREKIGTVPEAQKFQVAGQNRFGKPLSLSLLSKNVEELNAARTMMKNELNKFPALKDVTDNETLGRRELQLELKPKAYFLGLTHDAVTRQIRQGFFGDEVQRLQKGTDEVRVWVRYPEEDRISLGQLEQMRIKTADGSELPLSEIAEYGIKRGIVNIKHYNGFKEIKVEAELEDPDEPVVPITDKITNDIFPKIQAKYPSVSMEFGGQQRRTGRAF